MLNLPETILSWLGIRKRIEFKYECEWAFLHWREPSIVIFTTTTNADSPMHIFFRCDHYTYSSCWESAIPNCVFLPSYSLCFYFSRFLNRIDKMMHVNNLVTFFDIMYSYRPFFSIIYLWFVNITTINSSWIQFSTMPVFFRCTTHRLRCVSCDQRIFQFYFLHHSIFLRVCKSNIIKCANRCVWCFY